MRGCDPHGVQYAAERILNLDLQRQALAARAQSYMTAQTVRQMDGNKYGLSQDELDVANSSFSDLPPEERQRIYAENRARYQHLRATGQYRDDQGSVRR